MVFADSRSPDITEDLPLAISRRIKSAAAYVQGGAKYDIAIGGLPFLLAVNDQRVYQRETADFRKQQLDTSKEPGEQSLDQWWVRDQASWHRGAGVVFYEPGSDDSTQYRFASSAGVDIWTKGQMTLLHRMDLVAAVAAGQSCYTTTAVVGGTDAYFTNENGTVRRRTAAGSTTYSGSCIGPVAVAGANVLAGAATSIKSGLASGSTLTDMWTGASATPTPYWVKGRIIASVGNSLFELTLAGGTFGSQTPIHVHPDTGWTWTSVTEGPSAIYAAGYGNGVGAIYAFSLEDASSGTTPKLGQAYQVAEFPPGEEVHSIKGYLGTYLAIGTSKGLRVSIIGSDSTIQQGPLLFPTSAPVRSLAARDSYIYAGVEVGIDGNSGVYRVNLGEPVDDSGLRFAYATDAQTHGVGRVDSISFLGTTDQVALGVREHGVYLQSATNYEATGYVQSGRLRYATSELKAFRSVRLHGDLSAGAISVNTVSTTGTEAFILRVTSAFDLSEDIALVLPSGGQQYLSLKLSLQEEGGTPLLSAVQVKALPQVKRQRLIQLPLQCFDRELDRNHVRTGYNGGAADRLFALEALEDSQAVVQVEDFTSGESFAAQIEKVAFERNTPPTKAGPNFGGYLTVICRRL